MTDLESEFESTQRATRSHFSIDQHSTPHQLPEKNHGPQARSTM